MLQLPDRTFAPGGGRHETCYLQRPHVAIKFSGWAVLHNYGAGSRSRGSDPPGAVGRSTAAHRRSVLTANAMAGAAGDAGTLFVPRRQATLRPRTLRSAPPAPPPSPQDQQQQQQQSLPDTAADGPRVGATAVRTKKPRAAESNPEAGGARREVGAAAGTTRVLDPAAARPQQSQQPLTQHWDLQPRREQPAGQRQPAHQEAQKQQQQARAAPSGDHSANPRRGGSELRTGLALTFLGTNSGAPTLERNVSCTLVRLPGAVHMVDCGEGTQRQLMSLRGSLDPAEIDGIFITHLHGDHCFGLPAALGMLDEAKAAGQTDPARRRHHVYGPPGLAELIRVSMVATGLASRLQLPLTVTELVNHPHAAHPPMPLEQALQQQQHQQRHRQQQQAARGQQQQQLQQAALGGGRGGEGGGGGGVPVLVQRLAAQRVQDATELRAAVEAVQHRVAALEEIWSPPPPPPSPRYQPAGQYGRNSSYSGSDTDAGGGEPSSSVDDETDEPGGGGAAAASSSSSFFRGFVAAEGLYWELPGCAGVRVRAAQLQHRVACWGYVFTEARPYEEGARRRKVVVLGDTVSSRPIAPLAAGCDVMSHEATFARGMEAKARIAQHSTGWMAGAFAAAVGARSLVLTHFSARYREGPRDLDFGRPSSRASGSLEAEQQSWAVAGLLKEAAATYGRPQHLFAASDFYTHHVPPRLSAAAAPGA